MKTFSDAALEALERGDAIVSASVEIIPTEFVVEDTGGSETGAVLTWWQVSLDQFTDDEARMGLAFFNASATQLGATVWSTYSAPLAWTERTLATEIPYGTATIRIFQDRVRHFGVNNDGDIDDITLTIDGSPVTLTNPGAESGTTAGWTDVAGNLTIRTSDPAPHSGTYYFSGNDAQNIAYQDVVIAEDPPVEPDPTGSTIRLWGGYGDMMLPSDVGTSLFQGIGDRGLIQSSSGALGGSAQNTTLALSGIEPAAIEVLNPDEVKDASVVVRRLIFDSAGKTLLGSYVFSRGRLDELKTAETVGGPAAIQLNVEGAARGLGRRGGRLRSDADHRLVNSDDGFFKFVSYAGKKVLYWGGKKPSTLG